MLKDKIFVVSIVGPTASGKTDLSINLASDLCGEIISADSMQIYKEFNIVTDKPDIKILNKNNIKYHLINTVSVTENFNVAKFVDLAHVCIKNIYNNNKIPIICGGTGLYIDSVLNNIEFKIINNNQNIKEKLIENFEIFGNEYLIKKLEKIDKESLKNININNTKKIIRAIEFYYQTGIKMSEHIENSKKIISPYKICKIGLNFKNREILYNKINNRVDNMLKNGLLEEVKNIKNFKIEKTAACAIGYKELLPFLNNELDLNVCIDNLKRETRRYAKRQITWFKKDKNTRWIFIDEFNNYKNIIETAKAYILGE